MSRSLEFAGVASVVALTVQLGLGAQPSRPASQQSQDEAGFNGPEFRESVRRTEPRTPEEERQGFKLPPGFEISLYASEPDLTGKPINMAFDAKGRLWVTWSREYPFPAAADAGADGITILEDTDGDGRADRFTDFKSNINIPIGVLPYKDGAIAYSIPNVWRYSDTNADGKADVESSLLGPFQFVDTHGMVNSFVRGFDGWVHALHGFTNDSTVTGSDGHAARLRSGNGFRFRPDGSRVEHTSLGRINPFGQTFDELGYLYSSDCHTSPLHQMIRGGEYTRWYEGDGMGVAPTMKPRDQESTALAGLAYYSDDVFPQEYQKNFYIGDVMRSRIYRNSVEWRGSSPVGRAESDFLLSEDPWFRPVDIKLGPDGALYVADFYNRIIGHYEVSLSHPGRDRVRNRIWKITYKGQTTPRRNLTAASATELIAAFREANLPFRLTAADELVDRIGAAAVAPILALLDRTDVDAQTYVHGLWVLHRLNALDDASIARSANHRDPVVRLHALRIVAEREDPGQTFHPLVLQALDDEDPHVGRAAIEALAHYPGMPTVDTLLRRRRLAPAHDTHLIYTQRLVLRNLLRADKRLFADVVARQWDETDAAEIAGVVPGIDTPEAATLLVSHLGNPRVVVDARLPRVVEHAAKFIPVTRMTDLLQAARQRAGQDLSVEFDLASAARRGIGQRGEPPGSEFISWGGGLAGAVLQNACAASPEAAIPSQIARHRLAIEMAGDYRLAALEPQVIDCLEKTTNQDVKLAATKALMQMAPERNAERIRALLQNPSEPLPLKGATIRALAEIPGPVTRDILDSVDVAALPPNLQREVARSLAAMPQGKTLLFQRVREGRIPVETLLDPRTAEMVLLNISDTERAQYAKLTSSGGTPREEKDRLIRQRLTAFRAVAATPRLTEAGRDVFTRNCMACHQIDGMGARIGPELDGVRSWGALALAEKVLDPDRNVSEAFRVHTIVTTDNRILSGLFRRDEGTVLVFADVSGTEFSVPKDRIAKQEVAASTLMPDQFATTLSQDEFNALLAYLLSDIRAGTRLR